MFIELGAISDSLVTPNIPTGPTAKLLSKIFFDTSSKRVPIVFNTGVLRHILFYVLDGRYLVVEFEVIESIR